MDVCLVDENDGVAGLVGDGVVDLLFAGDGAGGIVGIADVDDAGVIVRFEHGIDVVGVVLGQRNGVDGSPVDLGGTLALPRRWGWHRRGYGLAEVKASTE